MQIELIRGKKAKKNSEVLRDVSAIRIFRGGLFITFETGSESVVDLEDVMIMKATEKDQGSDFE